MLLVAKRLNLRTDCLVCKREAPVVLMFNRLKGPKAQLGGAAADRERPLGKFGSGLGTQA